ncbi:MAG: hypothetical protein ACI8S6_002794 [Myxococcota bacterium]|jgi:hypothetical protein
MPTVLFMFLLAVPGAHASESEPERSHATDTVNATTSARMRSQWLRVLRIWDRGRRPAVPLTAPAAATPHEMWLNDTSVAPNDRAGGPQP